MDLLLISVMLYLHILVLMFRCLILWRAVIDNKELIGIVPRCCSMINKKNHNSILVTRCCSEPICWCRLLVMYDTFTYVTRCRSVFFYIYVTILFLLLFWLWFWQQNVNIDLLLDVPCYCCCCPEPGGQRCTHLQQHP